MRPKKHIDIVVTLQAEAEYLNQVVIVHLKEHILESTKTYNHVINLYGKTFFEQVIYEMDKHRKLIQKNQQKLEDLQTIFYENIKELQVTELNHEEETYENLLIETIEEYRMVINRFNLEIEKLNIHKEQANEMV
jgi:hypothetical protein